MTSKRIWSAFAVVVVAAVALIASLLTTTGPVSKAAQGGLAKVTGSTTVCPDVFRGRGGVGTDVTVARVTTDGAPRVALSHLGARPGAQRLKLAPSTVLPQAARAGSVAVTASGLGSEGLVATRTGLTPAGPGRGLADTACLPPSTDSWLVGADGRIGFSDWLVVANPSDAPANVAISFWSSRGPLSPPGTSNLIFTPHSVLARPVSNFAPDVPGLALHVHANSGTVVAWVSELQFSGTTASGTDWIAPSVAPARTAVVTGFISGATFDRLDLVNPGDKDATVGLRLLTPTRNFVPAGHQSVVVPAGHTTSVDLSGSVSGESAAVLITSDVPVTASGLTAQAPSNGLRELAWLPAQAPLRSPAGIANNAPPFDQRVHLILTAPQATARVRVSQPSGRSIDLTVTGGRTADVDLEKLFNVGPSGPGPLLITPLDAPVCVARMLYAVGSHGPLFAVSVPTVLPQPTHLPPVVPDLRAALP